MKRKQVFYRYMKIINRNQAENFKKLILLFIIFLSIQARHAIVTSL